MNPIEKKYFSISEVSQITGVPVHKLRYLEKSKTGIEVFQIRGRRYYTASDIALINKILEQNNKSGQLNLFVDNKNKPRPDLSILTKIDSLIAKFETLEAKQSAYQGTTPQ